MIFINNVSTNDNNSQTDNNDFIIFRISVTGFIWHYLIISSSIWYAQTFIRVNETWILYSQFEKMKREKFL